MDFSGFGMTLISCLFVTMVTPVLAGAAWLIVMGVRKVQGLKTDKAKGGRLFLTFFILSFMTSCIFIYFTYLRYMYVM